ncbi:hypothetical protein A4X06_0g1527 [Tilletia controversa]|uniref:E3 ubiquitin-protein ligase listerin n=1 Tax=Tilletia controversa TaxID=13291 RepID=A0A8X7MXH1_9BASI|nr:hypothetical protein CF328_g1081 [Tilletia controversa]KAE8253344.1 hypothetical protein A4X06_0g1527 [Tilletia controversa]
MAKGGGKSSASSATRKKQAAKAAKKTGGDHGPSSQPSASAKTGGNNQRGQKKDKKAPKKKVFIPPPKPPQPAPDPLDALGLAALLPPDLVVHLRKASKKDVLTRQRALESLQAWIRGQDTGEEAGASALSEEERISALTVMLPSWVHIFPRLSISPTRRLRILTAQILSDLLQLPDVRSELLFSPQYAEALIGPWAVLAWDTDRQTARIAREAWDKSVSWQSSEQDSAVEEEAVSSQKLNAYDQLESLLAHLSVLLLTFSPSTVLAHNAPHASTPAAGAGVGGSVSMLGPDSSLRDAKNRDDTVEEDVAATDRRLAAGALGNLAWIVSSHPAPLPAEQLERLVGSPSLWSTLAPINFDTGGAEEEQLPFLGLASPPTRQRAWDLLKVLVSADLELVKAHILSIAAPIALVSAWEEREQLVQKNMLVSFLPLLRALPETWSVADAALGGDEDGEDDEDEDQDDDEDGEEGSQRGTQDEGAGPSQRKSKGGVASSPSFSAFEKWIQTGCSGAPELCFPTIVLFLATVPASILAPTQTASARFLADFPKALHTNALESRPAAAAYISAFCDCTVFLAHRLLKAQGEDDDVASFVSDHLGLLWNDLVLGGGAETTEEGEGAVQRVSGLVSERAVIPVAECIEQLAGFGDKDTETIVPLLRRISADTLAVTSNDTLPPARVLAILNRALGPLEKLQRSPKLSTPATSEVSGLILKLADVSMSGLTSGDATRSKISVSLLSDLLKRFPSTFAASEETLTRALAIGSEQVPALFASGTLSARETIAALAALSTVSERTAASMREIWPRMVQVVLQLPDAGTQAGAVVELLPAVRTLQSTSSSSAAAGGGAEDVLTPALKTALSEIAVDLTRKLCEGEASSVPFQGELARAIGGIVALPPSHIDLESLGESLALLTSLVEHVGLDTLTHQHPLSVDVVDTQIDAQLPHALDVLTFWLGGSSGAEAKEMMHAGETWSVVPIVFALAQPDLGDTVSAQVGAAAAAVWKSLSTDDQAVSSVDDFVRRQFQETSLGVSELLALSKAADTLSVSGGESRLAALLPSDESMLAAASGVVQQGRLLPILSVLDPLIPLFAPEDDDEKTPETEEHAPFDRQGFSSYVRSVLVHLELCSDDRAYRTKSAWILPHLILLGIISEDRLSHSGAWHSIISSSCPTETVRDILGRCVTTSTAILSALASTLDSEWHTTLTADLQSSKSTATDSVGLAETVRRLWTMAKGSAQSVHYRIFSRLLSGILTFSAAERADAERWLRLAQQVQAQDGELAQAIVIPAKILALGSPLYERLCNEAAARLAGVPPSKANTEGVALLRMANAIAPPPTSENAFIPQQRAIFLLQALQKWMASEEDLAEEINTLLASLFIHLAPIVQNVSGSHLDFFFDVIETNLDMAVESVDDGGDDGISAAFYTLKLLETTVELAESNATLRDVYQERQDDITELVSRLFTGLAPSATSSSSSAATRLHSVPREICNNLLVDLIHRIPESKRASLVSEPEVLATLLSHRAQQVQVVSYRLLSAYVFERVQEAVVEAAVSSDVSAAGSGAGTGAATATATILPALLPKASQTPDAVLEQVDDLSHRHEIFGFLLTWLTILDHFEQGSLQLKSVYLAQLQKSDVAALSLFPTLFGLFAVTQHSSPFDAGKVAIDEVFFDDLELSRMSTIQVLAGHVFYRALIHLPALVRSWWFSIKDRQLSLLVASFTTRHCSPLLAAKELAHLRAPEALSQLQDESLAVRVLSGTNEVIATYTVDEHPMEIGIRLPVDYPLHGAEIRDIKRMGGVSEGQWRAWLLAVQQLISSRNGLVFDALMLFKKNAEAKFSGFEGRECAICYSIISPIDESLPTKPCKTCKNSFHSSCLLKWVVQSGSSTCPLCRSII